MRYRRALPMVSADRKRLWTHRCGGTEIGMRSHKYCSACNKQFPATTEFFHRNNSSRDGLQERCKPCKIAQACKSREKNRPVDAGGLQTYCFVDREAGLLKIGRTSQGIAVRLRACRTGNQRLEVMLTVRGDKEFELRRLLDGFRIKGDMFKFDESVGRMLMRWSRGEKPTQTFEGQGVLF